VDCGFVIWKGAKHRAQGVREVIEIVKSAYAVYHLLFTPYQNKKSGAEGPLAGLENQ